MAVGNLTKEEVEYLTSLFHHYDAECSKDGALSVHELHRLSQDFGFKINDRTFVKWFNDFDKDGSGSLCLNEFIQIFSRKPRADIEEANTERIFRELDEDGSGYVSPGEITRVFKKNGIKTSEEEINAMMNDLDKNTDGQLSIAEFKVLWQKISS